MVRLVHQATEQAAATHGPVRWLVLRVLPNIITYFNLDSHGHDPCYGPDQGIIFPDNHYYYQTLNPGTNFDEDVNTERQHPNHDKHYKPRTEKLHNNDMPDMPPIYPMPSHNSDRFRR